MWLAQSYCDVDLGLFSTEAKARAALVRYHGSELEAERWGYVREYEVDVFDDAMCQRVDYREHPLVGPVPAPQPLPHTVAPGVRVMPLRTTYSPTQAVQMALNYSENLTEVIVIGQFEEQDGKSALLVSPSKMSISMAVWLHRRLGLYIDENA